MLCARKAVPRSLEPPTRAAATTGQRGDRTTACARTILVRVFKHATQGVVAHDNATLEPGY